MWVDCKGGSHRKIQGTDTPGWDFYMSPIHICKETVKEEQRLIIRKFTESQKISHFKENTERRRKKEETCRVNLL